MSNIRTVSFYSLTIDKEQDNKKSRTAKRWTLSPQEVEDIFITIYNEYMTELKAGSRATEVSTINNAYVVEVLEYQNHIIFARIGQPNPSNTVGLRDTKTLESSEVPMQRNQLLETYTYTLIDLGTGVISYIGINGAPRISALKELFNLPFKATDHTTAYVSSILSEDIIKQITKKDIIGSITVSIALPTDTVLEESVGVSKRLFEGARNIKRETKTYQIVAKQKKSLFDKGSQLAKIFSGAQKRYGDDLVQFTVRAKDYDEQGQDYNLLKYHFTKKTALKADKDHNLLDAVTFKTALERTYKESYKELVDYIR